MPTRIQGKIKPLKKRVLVSNMHFGMLKTKAGVILPDNDGTAAGTHPRWAKVYAVGNKQEDVKVGQWILVAHGRWSRAFKIKRKEKGSAGDKKCLKDGIKPTYID